MVVLVFCTNWKLKIENWKLKNKKQQMISNRSKKTVVQYSRRTVDVQYMQEERIKTRTITSTSFIAANTSLSTLLYPEISSAISSRLRHYSTLQYSIQYSTVCSAKIKSLVIIINSTLYRNRLLHHHHHHHHHHHNAGYSIIYQSHQS